MVGGVCAVLHGAPVATFDLDLVHSRAADNLERLLAALGELEAEYRTPGPPGRRPDRSHLASAGHLLLMTRHGPLDLLGAIGHGHDYFALLSRSVEMEVGGGVVVRVLDLPSLIQVKEQTGGEKDRAALATLRRTLEESRKRERD